MNSDDRDNGMAGLSGKFREEGEKITCRISWNKRTGSSSKRGGGGVSIGARVLNRQGYLLSFPFNELVQLHF